MEPKILTQADIDKLMAAGINSSFDANVGDQALEDEAAFLNGPSITPVSATVPAEAVETFAPPAADVGPDVPDVVPAAPVAAAPAPAQNNMALIQQMLAAQAPPVSADPYENMSKTQRQMLAFSALSDAGASLAGRQSNRFGDLMGRFNEQADMTRKATTAQAQRQMLQGLMGGGAAGGDPQARIQQLLNIAMVNPSMAPAIALQVKQIQDQLQATSAAEGKVSQAGTQLDDVQALLDMINDDPFMTTGIMSSLLSGVKVTAAGQAASLQKTLKSNLALQALKDLKATGATMGALNTTEFQALESELTNLDLGLGAELSKRSLLRIQDKYQSLIADAYRSAEAAGETETVKNLDRILKGRPEWLSEAGPVVPSGPRANETEEEFKKRMGL